MRRAASSAAVRLSRHASRELADALPGLAPRGAGDEEDGRRSRQGGERQGRGYTHKLAAALHLAATERHLHQQEHPDTRPLSVREPAVHPHKHHSHRAPWLRAFVLGANDGLVSTSSLLMGVGAASSDHHTIVLSGVAGLVGGALSMAVGAWCRWAAVLQAALGGEGPPAMFGRSVHLR